MPKRSSVEDYFDKLPPAQRPHLDTLRELSLKADPKAREELKWNLPVYERDANNRLWMLQNFKNHCSLRFPPRFFAQHQAELKSAGYETGAAFLKLPYDADIPVEVCKQLMQARADEYEQTGLGWGD